MVLIRIMKDFDSFLFNIDLPSRSPERGMLLVAEPFLREPHFCHSVVMLVDYSAEGTAMGIVVNQPTTYTLQQLLPSVSAAEPVRVYCGGPMSTDRLYFLHTLGDLFPGARRISDGLWIGGEFESMERYLADGYPVEGVIRFCLGYSGWEPGQLDQEIESHVWTVATPPAPEELLTSDGDAMWHKAVRSLGETFRTWQMYPRNLQSN